MRRILLSIALVVSLAGFAKAQESTGPDAEQVKKVIMDLEEQKQNCFSPIGEVVGNWCADWVKWHDADGLVHYTDDRLRPKEELMDELRSGMRRNVRNSQTNHVFHVYGNGDDGTTVVVTYTSAGTIIMYGTPHTGSGGFGIDVWHKVNGRWWFVAHAPHHAPSPAATAKASE